jgi:glycosyltransferase involved in cell wall biosynthesis
MRSCLHVRFVAISDVVYENEKQVFKNPCSDVIYNWCDNHKFGFVGEQEKRNARHALGVADDTRLCIVSVGNCGAVKNHALLLRAIAKMKYRENICYFHVGYAAGETEAEEQLAQELGIGKQIVFAGHCDPVPYLSAANVFVLTSRYEGFSIATLEAAFTGLAILLADAPGLIEYKNKGFDSIEYFAMDEAVLAQKLDVYVQRYKEGSLKPNCAQCNQAAQLYDIETQAGKYVRLYQELAGESYS